MSVPFHGEFGSADASALSEANSRILLYGAGSTTAITLAATNQVVITYYTILAGAALTVTLYDGADATVGAGEVVARGNYGANGGERALIGPGHHCQPGTWPKVKVSAAGQVDVIIHGYIK